MTDAAFGAENAFSYIELYAGMAKLCTSQLTKISFEFIQFCVEEIAKSTGTSKVRTLILSVDFCCVRSFYQNVSWRKPHLWRKVVMSVRDSM